MQRIIKSYQIELLACILGNSQTRSRLDKKTFLLYLCYFIVVKYFFSRETNREEPKIVHGRTAYDLPPRSLGIISKPIVTAMTGPNGGLTTVNQRERHLSISDPDVHFIDVMDEDAQSGTGQLIGLIKGL